MLPFVEDSCTKWENGGMGSWRESLNEDRIRSKARSITMQVNYLSCLTVKNQFYTVIYQGMRFNSCIYRSRRRREKSIIISDVKKIPRCSIARKLTLVSRGIQRDGIFVADPRL